MARPNREARRTGNNLFPNDQALCSAYRQGYAEGYGDFDRTEGSWSMWYRAYYAGSVSLEETVSEEDIYETKP